MVGLRGPNQVTEVWHEFKALSGLDNSHRIMMCVMAQIGAEFSICAHKALYHPIYSKGYPNSMLLRIFL
ncbi:hypothetical protein AYI70_g10005 [Smittium culicis]|uniref:Uncharacterized protein n=1 Tax=Smittium culicis TaxID=133412 RepID=A0A1R1X8M3_9FUNG|nr:hypothetical protein AYI70_g10005 [Smittium culicis]